jgi:hypothetical protein
VGSEMCIRDSSLPFMPGHSTTGIIEKIRSL